jgi:hypothetical protein
MPVFSRPITPSIAHAFAIRKHLILKNKIAQQFLAADNAPMFQALHDCSQTESLIGCAHCGHKWWTVTRCRQRVCPICSYRTARKRAQYLKALTAKMKHPLFLTLTMPRWTGEPKEGIDKIRHCWLRLKHQRLFSNLKGGAYQIEVKIKDTGFHIHMHLLLDSPYIPRTKIFAAWRALLNIPVAQVDIRSAVTDRAREYITKYTAKSAGFDSDSSTVVAWYNATKGSRLFATFGTWHNATLEDLTDNTLPQTFVPTCPVCHTPHTIFFARDGPYVFGAEMWKTMQSHWTVEGLTTRPIPDVHAVLTHDFTQQQKEAICTLRKTNSQHSTPKS